MNVKIDIKNGKEIRRAFALAPGLMTKNLNRAVKASTLNIQRASMRVTPVDTGFLRASHITTMTNPVQGEVAVLADYAEFVHDGTKFMKARPFLADAVEFEDGFIQAEFKDAVERTMKEIGAKA